VELLVVIVIIGILAGLITVGAAAALRHAKNTKIKAEISQIDTALRAYQQKYGSYPPDSWEFGDAASKARFVTHIQRAFPRVAINPMTGLPYSPTLPLVADPAEALVFWLRGFNPDPTNPLYEEEFTDANGNHKWDTGEAFTDSNSNGKYDGRTDAPIFNFEVTRLVVNPANALSKQAVYVPSGYKMPYTYFNIVGLMANPTPKTAAPSWDPEPSTGPDANGMKAMAVPYFKQAPATAAAFGTPVSEEGFQIVSAGQDDEYGLVKAKSGGAGLWKPDWDVAAGYKIFPTGTNYSPADNDNITSFNEKATLDDARP
jgi:type II secretory pathway pseudopilin PulG